MEGKENSIQTRTPYNVHVSFGKCKLNPHLKRDKNCKISFQLTVDMGK
jgi:hypothetical protein